MTRKPKCYSCSKKPSKDKYVYFCTKNCAAEYGIFMAQESDVSLIDGQWSLPSYCTACDYPDHECICVGEKW